MGPNYRTVGGGRATGLADDFISLLQSGLSGRFAPGNANPYGSTAGIAGVLNDILAGGAGRFGGALSNLIHADTERQAADLRARFGAQGGASFGTPAAYAESLFRSEAAPRAATAIGQLQLSALAPLLQIISGLGERGIPQATNVASPSPLTSFLSTGAQLASSLAPFFISPFGGGRGSVSPFEYNEAFLTGLPMAHIPFSLPSPVPTFAPIQ